MIDQLQQGCHEVRVIQHRIVRIKIYSHTQVDLYKHFCLLCTLSLDTYCMRCSTTTYVNILIIKHVAKLPCTIILNVVIHALSV